MKVSKSDQAEALESLRKWIKAGDKVYTILDHVSRSGMQRRIRVLVPYIEDDGKTQGGFVHPNYAVSMLTGYRQASKGDGLVVGGCGMDMGWHLVYQLSSAMFRDGFGCVGKGCPSNDHSNGDRDYTPNPHGQEKCQDVEGCKVKEHWHRDGGYALRQSWL